MKTRGRSRTKRRKVPCVHLRAGTLPTACGLSDLYTMVPPDRFAEVTCKRCRERADRYPQQLLDQQ